MISDKSLWEIKAELGDPLYTHSEAFGSDLRRFYAQEGEDTSAYQRYLMQVYSGVFGDRRINEHHTIAEWLESAELEMVRNAAEWGNKGFPYEHVIVGRDFYPSDVLIHVRDGGGGFNYSKVIRKNEDILATELVEKDPEQIQLLTKRRPSIYSPSMAVRVVLRALESLSRRQIRPDGGQGFKRFILDSHGTTGFMDEGTMVYYHLPNVDVSQEDLEKIKGMRFYDFLKER
jgi:hypothetical protein